MIFAIAWMLVGACSVIAIYCGVQAKRHAERALREYRRHPLDMETELDYPWPQESNARRWRW